MNKAWLNNILAKMALQYHDDTAKFGIYYIIAICIGLFCGAAAAALKSGIGLVKEWVFSMMNIHAGNWVILLLPVVGILICVLYTRYVTKSPMDDGTNRIKTDLRDGNNKMSPRLIFGSIITCSFTLGMGGSAGAESPIAYSGAAIGSNVGRALKLSDDSISNLLGCGAAAGIAGIYMAPIGGVMYAFEVLRMKQTLPSALGMTFSCLTSALTCYVLLGCHTDVSFVPEMRFDNRFIPHVIIGSILCGAYSSYYKMMILYLKGRFGRMTNIWLKALLGGVILAICLFMFPALYGEGYSTIGKLMENDPMSVVNYSIFYQFGKHYDILLLLLMALLFIKPIATAATNYSGGVGGDFTPTLFCGGVLGFFFAAVLHYYFGMTDVPYALFAFFGMAAVMAGSKNAPLMGIFITAEMTGLYGFILPLTIAALVSFLTSLSINKICFRIPVDA